MANEECCPKFNPEKWDEKSFTWENKKFIKESIPTFFHIPLPSMIEKKMTKLMGLATESNKLDENMEDTLVLFRDPSAFKSEIHLSVTDEVEKADNVKLSGKYEAKVFDGPYNAIPKFIGEMNKHLGKDVVAQDYYIHYAYCPKCAKKFGNNYMILFAKV